MWPFQPDPVRPISPSVQTIYIFLQVFRSTVDTCCDPYLYLAFAIQTKVDVDMDKKAKVTRNTIVEEKPDTLLVSMNLTHSETL